MGTLAAAGWAWSAHGEARYGGKWAWLAERSRCTASSWAHISGVSGQATITQNAIVACTVKN